MCLKSTSRRFSPDGAWNQLPPEIFTFHHNIWWGVLSAQFLMEGPPCCLSVKSSRFLANFQHVGRLPPVFTWSNSNFSWSNCFFDWSNLVIFSSSNLDCFLLLKPFPLHTSPFAKILGFSISTILQLTPLPPPSHSVQCEGCGLPRHTFRQSQDFLFFARDLEQRHMGRWYAGRLREFALPRGWNVEVKAVESTVKQPC